MKAALAFILLTSVFVVCFASEMTFHDRKHLQSHMVGELDLSRSSEEELRFIYFQSHDTEGNHKLDGCELIQSVLHFHAEEATTHGQDFKVFSDAELSMMIDPLLGAVDKNLDGFIDYPEFVAGPGIISY